MNGSSTINEKSLIHELPSIANNNSVPVRLNRKEVITKLALESNKCSVKCRQATNGTPFNERRIDSIKKKIIEAISLVFFKSTNSSKKKFFVATITQALVISVSAFAVLYGYNSLKNNQTFTNETLPTLFSVLGGAFMSATCSLTGKLKKIYLKKDKPEVSDHYLIFKSVLCGAITGFWIAKDVYWMNVNSPFKNTLILSTATFCLLMFKDIRKMIQRFDRDTQKATILGTAASTAIVMLTTAFNMENLELVIGKYRSVAFTNNQTLR